MGVTTCGLVFVVFVALPRTFIGFLVLERWRIYARFFFFRLGFEIGTSPLQLLMVGCHHQTAAVDAPAAGTFV